MARLSASYASTNAVACARASSHLACSTLLSGNGDILNIARVMESTYWIDGWVHVGNGAGVQMFGLGRMDMERRRSVVAQEVILPMPSLHVQWQRRDFQHRVW